MKNTFYSFLEILAGIGILIGVIHQLKKLPSLSEIGIGAIMWELGLICTVSYVGFQILNGKKEGK